MDGDVAYLAAGHLVLIARGKGERTGLFRFIAPPVALVRFLTGAGYHDALGGGDGNAIVCYLGYVGIAHKKVLETVPPFVLAIGSHDWVPVAEAYGSVGVAKATPTKFLSRLDLG